MALVRAPTPAPWRDVPQEGAKGLLRAAELFDPRKGVPVARSQPFSRLPAERKPRPVRRAALEPSGVFHTANRFGLSSGFSGTSRFFSPSSPPHFAGQSSTDEPRLPGSRRRPPLHDVRLPVDLRPREPRVPELRPDDPRAGAVSASPSRLHPSAFLFSCRDACSELHATSGPRWARGSPPAPTLLPERRRASAAGEHLREAARARPRQDGAVQLARAPAEPRGGGRAHGQARRGGAPLPRPAAPRCRAARHPREGGGTQRRREAEARPWCLSPPPAQIELLERAFATEESLDVALQARAASPAACPWRRPGASRQPPFARASWRRF